VNQLLALSIAISVSLVLSTILAAVMTEPASWAVIESIRHLSSSQCNLQPGRSCCWHLESIRKNPQLSMPDGRFLQ
jgi:hypothetical protein